MEREKKNFRKTEVHLDISHIFPQNLALPHHYSTDWGMKAVTS